MNLLIGIIAALVVVVGGGAYVAMNPEVITSITGGSSGEGEMMENGEGSASVGNNFAALIALGQSVECTFSHDDGAGNRSSGTMYITGGATQIRGDFTVEAAGAAPMHGSMIRTGGYNYLWSDTMPQGVKTRVVNETEFVSGDQTGAIDEDTEFSCQAWSVDGSKFTVPNSIQFMEVNVQAMPTVDTMIDANTGAGINTTVPAGSAGAAAGAAAGAGVSGSSGSSGTSGSVSGSAGTSGSTSGTSAQCAACNQLPPGAKEQCLAALAC